MNTYFIADTHFGHTRVIQYDSRPFSSVEEMDAELIKRWNSTVHKEDVVWMLGDLALGYNAESLRKLVPKLNGNKRLVTGNHDTRPVKFYYDCGFTRVYDKPVILKNFFILSHHPIAPVNDSTALKTYPFYNIFGHVHNSEQFSTETESSICVSCCRWDYRPIRIKKFDKYCSVINN